MARHRLVHHQVVQHVPVVFAVERGDPLRRPVRWGGGDGDECRHRRHLQRPGRIAVGHRDAAVDLRHLDHLDRVVEHRDQPVLPDEGGLCGERAAAERQDVRVIGRLGGQLAEDLPDDRIALGCRPAWAAAPAVAAGDLGRQRRDLLADPVQVGVRPGQDGVRVGLGVQGQGQLPREQLGADPRVREPAVRGTLAEPRGQPRAVPGQRVQSGRAHGGDVVAAFRRVPQGSVDDVGDQGDRARELGDRGLQVHLWHGSQQLPGGGQGRGDPGQPASDRGEAIWQRGEVPGEQPVDGPARVGQQRVPGVLTQLVMLEDLPGHVVRHHGRVHLVLRRQRGGIHRAERGRPVVQGLPVGCERVRGGAGQLGVEPVVA